MKREDLSLLADPTVELIKPYKFVNRSIAHDHPKRDAEYWNDVCANQGGFNPVTRELTPMQPASANVWLHEVLDHITAAVEAGVVDKNRWEAQLFADEDELEYFLEELECYDDCYRITCRWWESLARLAGRVDEEGFISCQEIAEGLRESIGAGHERREVLRQEAEYFAKNPLATVKGTRAQQEALERHNSDVRAKAYKSRLEKDVSYSFRFTQPFYFIKSKKLAARQVTKDDLAMLATPKQQAITKASGRPSKARKTAPHE